MQVKATLKKLLPHLVELSIAPIEMDTKCATDFTVRLTGGDIAVRLRRPECQFRDLTIRALRDKGVKTELAKIKEGYGSRYFYGWVDSQDKIAEWILVDLNRLRKTSLLEKPLIANKDKDGKSDGTYFIAISLRELCNAKCLIAYHYRGRKWESAA
jgi:hypothetical protein